MTGHGFRSMASTLLHEQGWNHQVIERQLAHAERNAVSAAYNFAEDLPERRKMMQAWADYLDGLKAGAAVIPLFKRANNIQYFSIADRIENSANVKGRRRQYRRP
jgi:hypothetical protein